MAEWGDGFFGIEAASRFYYGKPALELNASEAARLAAVLPNPRRFIPTGSSRFVENRSARIYQIMVRRGIVIDDFEEIMREPELQGHPRFPSPGRKQRQKMKVQ